MESSLHVFCVPGHTDIASSPLSPLNMVVSRSSSSTKTDGVTAEDNPAYGVSLGLPYEVPAVTKSPPDPPPESVYEPIPH